MKEHPSPTVQYAAMGTTVPSHRILPRSKKEWHRLAAVIVVFALAAHFAIGIASSINGTPSDQPWWLLLIFSLVYTIIIFTAQIFSGEVAHRILPLRSKMAVVGHILIQSLSGVVAFWAAMRIEELFRGTCSIPADKMLIIVGVTFVLSLIGNAGFYFVYFQRRVRAAEQAVLESELTALRAQINPHFLFNTLNSIAALIRINPDEAEQVTEHLADLFRYSLRSSKTPLVTLEEEVHSVKVYLRIEQARFRERLNILIDIPIHLHNAAVPSLLLQPLVENAIKHGVQSVEGQCTLQIEAKEHNGVIHIAVRDSGVGFDLNAGDDLFYKGTGLANVRDRLTLLFPDSGAMRFEKNAVVLTFPYQVRSEDGIMHPYRSQPSYLRTEHAKNI